MLTVQARSTATKFLELAVAIKSRGWQVGSLDWLMPLGSIFIRLVLCRIVLGLSCLSLTGCLGQVWTGVSLIYDRHATYKKTADISLAAKVGHELAKDKLFKCPGCFIDLAVCNQDLLLVGHVPTLALRQEAEARVEAVSGYRRFFNQLAVGHPPSNSFEDGWITAKIRSQIISDSNIDPHQFKVITCDGIVYLMGDVDPSQAKLVIQIARSCEGVRRVVKLFQYYHLSKQA